MSPQPSTQIAPTLRARLPYYPGYTDIPNYQPPTIIPEGDGSNGIWLVGEASGENEARDGLPFRPYAPAGSVLERAMREIGLARQECTISNMVWYQPPRNWLEHAPYEQAAVEVCRPLNDHLFSLRKPKVIVALGNVAFRYLTGIRAPKWIPSRQKKSWTLSAMRGWAFHSDDPVLGCHFGDGRVRQGDCWYEGVPVVPTYHPSFLRRGSKEADEQVGGGAKVSAAGGGTGGGMGLLGVLKDDLKRAWAIAQGRAQKMHWRIYEDCRPQDMQKVIDRCLADPTLLVSYDFETAESVEGSEDEVEQFGAPTQFQVALDEKEAYVWLWTPELLPYLKRLLELPNPKLDWNGRGFDRQLIRRLGIRVDQGIWHDGMDLWGFWQPDLPRGLQYAASFTNELDSAWKHTFPIVPQVYGGLDVLWPQRLWDKLKVWMGQVRSRQSGIDVWSAYRDQVVRLAPGLDEMEEIGIPISETKRLEVKERLHKMAEEEFLKIQSMVPQEVRKLEPKNGYANDKVAEKVKASGKLELGEEWITKELLVEVKPKKNKKGQTDEQLGLELEATGMLEPKHQLVTRQFRLQPFLVTSPQQLKDYINWKRQEEITARVARGQLRKDAERLAKYCVPVDWKTRKETTSKKELEKLFEKTGDPLFKSAILYREIRKMDGTYVGDRDEDEETGEVTNVTGWAPQADGRVHPHFGFGTGIGQLTAKNPNSMNMTRHNKVFGDMLREMVEAPDGYVWVTADMKSFHVLTLGFEADDPNYMRLARLDMHSFFAAVGLLKLYKPEHLLDLPDQELMAKLKWHREKDTRDYGGKSFGVIRDTRAKRCIAEGQLVLTDQGEVPIENVTLDMKVWDGVDWVTHAGVICQGEREVIEYEGLIATPDHKVVLANGCIETLGNAALGMERLECTGIDGRPVRTRHGNILRDSARKRIQESISEVPRMWGRKVDRLQQFTTGQFVGMPILQYQKPMACTGSFGQALRRNNSALPQASLSGVQAVRGPRNRVQIPIENAFRRMGEQEFASCGLQRNRDRSQGQRWALRARKFKTGNPPNTDAQHTHKRIGSVARKSDWSVGFPKPVHIQLDGQTCTRTRTYRGTDNRTGEDCCSSKGETLAENRTTPKRARTYDIADAGPRRCFTVSGKLVLNCILGYGNGLSGTGMYRNSPEDFNSRQDAETVIDALDNLFPKPCAYRKAQAREADQTGMLVSRYGFNRRFNAVFEKRQLKWNERPKNNAETVVDGRGNVYQITHGNDYEAAISFRHMNDAFGMIRAQMIQLRESGLSRKYGLCNNEHDALKFCCPQVYKDECIDMVRKVMQAPSPVLRSATVPDGLWCEVEMGVGKNWAKMEKLK